MAHWERNAKSQYRHKQRIEPFGFLMHLIDIIDYEIHRTGEDIEFNRIRERYKGVSHR
jgi:hypothetical protein